MAEKSNTLVILAMIVILVVVAGGSFFGGAFWRDIIGYDQDNYSSIGLTITYEDGTTKDFKASGFQLVPLKITDTEGGTVTKVDATCNTKITHTVTEMSKYEYNVMLDVQNEYLTDMGWTSSGWMVQDDPYLDMTTGSWPSGGEKVKPLRTFTADDIESRCSYGSGTYRLTYRATVTVWLYDDSGGVSREGYGQLEWQYDYDESIGEITSMSVTIKVIPTYG